MSDEKDSAGENNDRDVCSNINHDGLKIVRQTSPGGAGSSSISKEPTANVSLLGSDAEVKSFSENTEEHCCALFYQFIRSQNTKTLKHVCADLKVVQYGTKEVIVARCMLEFYKKRISNYKDIPIHFKHGDVLKYLHVFLSLNEGRLKWPCIPSREVLMGKVKDALQQAREKANAQKVRGTPSKRSTYSVLSRGSSGMDTPIEVTGNDTNNSIDRLSSRPSKVRRIAPKPDHSKDSDGNILPVQSHLVPSTPKSKKPQKARVGTLHSPKAVPSSSPSASPHNMKSPSARKAIGVASISSGESEKLDAPICTPVRSTTPGGGKKQRKHSQKNNSKKDEVLSQFVRVLLLLRDDEMCREGMQASMFRVSRDELDNGDKLDDFWMTTVEKAFNSPSNRPQINLSTVLPGIEPEDPGIERDASWLKRIVSDTKAPFSRYFNKYQRSGQNDPDRFQKIITDSEQRERILLPQEQEKSAVLEESELEAQPEFPKMSPQGRRCLVTFHICRVNNGSAEFPFLLNYMLKLGSRVDENGEMKFCGRESGLPAFETVPTEKRGPKRRRSTGDRNADSDSMLGKLVDAVTSATRSRENRHMRREEARQSQNVATTDAIQTTKEMRMMALSEQLKQLNKSIRECKDGSDEDMDVLLMHKNKVLKKYKKMVQEDSADEEDSK